MAFVLVAELTLRRGCRERYLALLRETVAGLSSAACFVDFSIHVSQEEPERVLLYETWTSREAYVELRSGAVFQDYLTRREGLVDAVLRSEWALAHRTAPAGRQPALTAS